MATAMIPALFLCAMPVPIDADTLICQDGTRVRIAAINARERDGSCRTGAVCPIMPPERATTIVRKLVHRQTLRCRAVGRSYGRVVATCSLPDGHDLGCAVVRTGAAAFEPGWARKYKIGSCER